MRLGRKFRRRKFAPPPRKNILFVTFIIFIFCIVLSMGIISKGITPAIIEISELKTEEFATRAINQAVRFAESYDFDDILNITYDNEGNVVVYNWNQAIVSEITRVTTDRVEEYFQYMNSGDPVEYDHPLREVEPVGDDVEEKINRNPSVIEIPLGEITNNAVLANLGPKIPINLELVGAVRTSVVRDTEPLGINGSWVSLYVQVEADVQIIIPYITERKTVKTEIYIDGGAIMGEVPDFYGGDGKGPSIAIPKDEFGDTRKSEGDLHNQQ